MTKLSQIIDFENRPHTRVSKVKHKSAGGKTTWGPDTTTVTVHVNVCLNGPMNPDDDIDPSFVSLTAD